MATHSKWIIATDEHAVPRARAVLREQHGAVTELEHALSEFWPASPVYLLNRAPVGEWVAAPASARELLAIAWRAWAATAGAFDPLCKSQVRGAGPSAIEVDDAGERWRWRREGQHLGFGAIGKGYALDRVADSLRRAGFLDFNLSMGGSSIVLSGVDGQNEPWRWAWSWERDSEANARGLAFAHVRQAPITIGVSGKQEKGEHLIGPAWGPSNRSAIVTHASAAWSDALSTAVFLGAQPAQTSYAVLDAQGVPSWSAKFEQAHDFRRRLERDHSRGRAGVAPIAPIAPIALIALGGVAAETLFLLPRARAEDEAIDLGATSSAVPGSATGAPPFLPYLFTRNSAWIGLPLFFAVLVLFHLRRPPLERSHETFRR